MITQYKAADKIETHFGLDFFDANGNEVGDIPFGTDEAACAALLEELADDYHPAWPQTAVRVRTYTKQVKVTSWAADGLVDPYRRNPLTGRFTRNGDLQGAAA